MQEPVKFLPSTPQPSWPPLLPVGGPQQIIGEMRDAYKERRDELIEVLDRGDLTSSRPSGAFYVWTDISQANMPSMDFAKSPNRARARGRRPRKRVRQTRRRLRTPVARLLEDLLEGASRLVRFVHHQSEAHE